MLFVVRCVCCCLLCDGVCFPVFVCYGLMIVGVVCCCMWCSLFVVCCWSFVDCCLLLLLLLIVVVDGLCGRLFLSLVVVGCLELCW